MWIIKMIPWIALINQSEYQALLDLDFFSRNEPTMLSKNVPQKVHSYHQTPLPLLPTYLPTYVPHI